MSTSTKSAVGSNVISLPKGGGAVSGMGESFSPDLFTGTGNFSVPIAVPPGRNGLQPSLTLGYSTGSGNGPFGLGWNMSLPGVARKTNLGIPRYDDHKDVFVLSGAEDLIPVDRGQEVQQGQPTHIWVQYRPRTEGLFARIIHHKWSDGRDYWEVRTKDGMVTWYGDPDAIGEANTVIYDPENPRHIAQWSIFRTVDPFGNEVLYEYERDLELSPYPFAQLFLKRIKYADFTHNNEKKYLCSVELEYTDREDAHSEFRQGFEIRTRRRCTSVNTFTHPLDVHMAPAGYTPSGTNSNSIKVKSYALTYRDQIGEHALNKVSVLAHVQATGYARVSGNEVTESLPPVEFEYTDFDVSRRDLRFLDQAHLPVLGLNHPDMDLVDLTGNGLPDFIQMSAGQPIRYWRNKGRGDFELPRTMRNAPTGLALGSEAVQLMDADGDGRVDLVMNAPNFAGYYSLNHDGEWDNDSYRPYKTRPPVNLQSAQVQFMDLSGDGRTDVLINANRFECYFQNSPLLDANQNFDGLQAENRAVGWSEARFVNKGALEDFPNVDFSDPRIRTADLSGDGLQDIVMIQNGSVSYWPNLGYGRFGKRRTMRNSPRLGFNFNPAQLIMGDADGDGLTDLIYVERNTITIWINQSGNGFSDPIVITGTPAYTIRDSVRMVDIMGTGTPGILWSFDPSTNAGRPLGGARFAYLDLTGGVKPYVMVGMRNNLGARTRVHYRSSVDYYLRDTYKKPLDQEDVYDPMEGFVGYAGKWKTTLPMPVQVVSRVEVIDEISKGKLTTRYFYHHGYWDGGEREFRGFGRVDQFDTETFERYNHDNLILDQELTGVTLEHYAPPVLAKNWFHLGPVGAEKGDWKEVDFDNEFWSGDQNMLQRPPGMLQMIAGLPRRARRDAYRTLRGTALRSELYAMDGTTYQQRPYTVSETQTGLRLVASPLTNATIKEMAVETHSNHIFFSFGYASRSTTWERGDDPMTKFSFTGEIDNYGQPLSQVSIAVPRGKDPRTGGELASHSGDYDPAKGYDATIQFTKYIYVDPAIDHTEVPDAIEPAFEGQYVVDRAKRACSYEAHNDGAMSVFVLRDIMLGTPPDQWTGLGNGQDDGPKLLALSYTYYDGIAFDGDDYGEIGAYGVPVRTETLMVQPSELNAIYGQTHPPMFSGGGSPDWTGFPEDFVTKLQSSLAGYTYHAAGGVEDYVDGYYTSAERSKFDFHVNPATAKGLPVAMRDAFDHEAAITYDTYKLLPVRVVDPVGMETLSEYDYRVLQPSRVTDPNENISAFAFTPLGLMHKTALLGKDDSTEGDTLDDPGVLLEYDLFAFMNSGSPVWVKTTQREHHINADYLDSLQEPHATIVAVEYSDGFGRQLQTRTQAEDLIFGNSLLGDSGLPADQTANNANAVGVMRSMNDPLNVIVSGAKLYNNKGKEVEQWEPYFSQGFDHIEVAQNPGQRIRIYYDALGRPQKTINPDGTQQRVIYGRPMATTLELPVGNNLMAGFKPNPWERYTYDANDLQPLTHPSDTTVPASHRWTPKSEVIDALDRVVMTTEHKAHHVSGNTYDDVVMKYKYDIQGRLLEVTDPLNRMVFQHKYDTAGNNLWTEHLDSGEKLLAVDAQGKPLYSSDAKGAEVYTAYDDLHRPIDIWAKDKAGEEITLRQHMIYGDDPEISDPQSLNLRGQLHQHYDEAGKATITAYDFKGNPLEKIRQVLLDSLIVNHEKFVVDWNELDDNHLEEKQYITTIEYDALNRVRRSIYPEDLDQQRKVLTPTYNRAGALERVDLDGTSYIKHIAYNAKGQRLLLAMGNDMMTRYAYDPINYRLLRIRSEKYSELDHTYSPDGGVQQDLGYSYDLNGNIIGIRDKAPATTSAEGPGDLLKQFEYDPLNRLLSATGRESTQAAILPTWDAGVRTHDHTATNAYNRTYQFDKLGNVLQLQHTAEGNSSNSFTKTFQYHATQEHNKLLSFTVGGETYAYAYDANGNLLTENLDRHHEWSYDDKLKLFKIDAGGGPSKWAHYQYDTAGTRVKKVVNKTGGIQEVTICIDGVFEECYVKESGTINTDKHWNTLHVLDGNSRLATVMGGTDVDDATPAVKYNLEDHLGNSSVMVDDAGDLVNREEYYPYGDTSFGAFAEKRYRYNGKEKDNESGLYNYGMRYYAPWICRFVSVDPLAGEYKYLTPYNYAGNKPVGEVDVDGLQGSGNATDTPANGEGNKTPDNSKGIACHEYSEPDTIGSEPNTKIIPDATDSVHNYTGSLKYNAPDALDIKYNRPPDYVDRNYTSTPTEDNIATGDLVGFLGLGAEAIKNLGGLEKAQELIESGKWQAEYKGETKTWKINFHGNQSVDAEFVQENKVKFFDKAASNSKAFKILRGVSTGATIVGIVLLADQVNKEGWTNENKYDAAVTVIAFIPEVGWALALMAIGVKYAADEIEEGVRKMNYSNRPKATREEDQWQLDLDLQRMGVDDMNDLFRSDY